MSIAFCCRPPTDKEFEQIRLLLSTFQDGSGMLAHKSASGLSTLPGWRDFERTLAVALNGHALENKNVFDVTISDGEVTYGISCKMRGELNRVQRDGRVTIEVSNSNKKFWECLKENGISPEDYPNHPNQAGSSIINLVKSWHVEEAQRNNIDLINSCYLVLQWNKRGQYQLFQYSLNFIDQYNLDWCISGKPNSTTRLCGIDSYGTVVEWYGHSGGQLKYFPMQDAATWYSTTFNLEPIRNIACGIRSKAKQYFRDKWLAAQ